jgi:hypothetical protein
VLKTKCELISGQSFQPLFGQELDDGRLESWICDLHHLAPQEISRRRDRDLLSLDWQKEGVWYTAGLQKSALLFINVRFEPGQLPARRVIACLGSPHWYQAWYDSYVNMNFSSVHLTMVFPSRAVIAYASNYFSSASTDPPAINDSLPVTLISIFGSRWQEGERVLGKALPWPGAIQQLQVEVILHLERPVTSDRDLTADSSTAPVAEVLAEIDQAFRDAPRPGDDELLHPDARDESEIQALIGVPHWQELPDDTIENEYSALAFLGPTGFRHFLPAYLSWVLRHPDSDAAVISSTLYALTPAYDDPMRAFMLSKFSLLDEAQRAAVVSFLRAMIPYEDVAPALDYWLPLP